MRTPDAVLGIVGLLACTHCLGYPSVDYSTGQLSFSTPLVTVTGRKLSYTVSLRYNSDIKRGFGQEAGGCSLMPERAGWAGLGFEVETP